MRVEARLAAERLDLLSEEEQFRSGLDQVGAIVTFSGIARNTTAGGGEVIGLHLEHHPRLTERSLKEIAEDAGRQFDIAAICIVHRFGEIEPGEPIVFVAAAALHRRAALEATDYAMDRLKTEAFFWKREDYVDGSRWIEPTAADLADRARWSK